MYTLKRFKEIVDKLQATNSRNEKLAILDQHKNQPVTLYYMKHLFNPYTTTGIQDSKLSKPLVDTTAETEFVTMQQLLEYITLHNTGKDTVIKAVQNFMQTLPEDLVPLFKGLIVKHLTLGLTSKSINKIIPNLIPTFDVMLANDYRSRAHTLVGKHFYITNKIDGGRIIAVKKKGKVNLYTRAGQLYEGLVDIEEALKNTEKDSFVLDGEITLLDSAGMSSKEQYQATMRISRKLGNKKGLKLVAFDTMTVEQFENQSETLPYELRRANLQELVAASIASPFIEFLDIIYKGKDTTVIDSLLKSQTEAGEEGIMINVSKEPYKFGRGDALLKYKKHHTIDLTVKDLLEGTGANIGMLGAFVVDYKGFEVKVGSGISKEMREEVWNNKEKYVGKTIEVQYFEETTNLQQEKSLRFPVFIDMRYDK